MAYSLPCLVNGKVLLETSHHADELFAISAWIPYQCPDLALLIYDNLFLLSESKAMHRTGIAIATNLSAFVTNQNRMLEDLPE